MNEPTSKPKLWTPAIIVLLIANMMYLFGVFMMMPTVPLFVMFLGHEELAGAVAATFTASAIIMRLLSPKLLQRLGKKRMLRFSIMLTFAATAALALVDGMPGMFALRAVQGAGFGMVSTISVALAADFLPDSRRGEGLGYFGMGTTVMIAVAPTLGLFLSRTVGFPTMFLVASAGQVLALFSLLFFKPPKGPEPPTPEQQSRNSFKNMFVPILVLQCGLLVLFGVGRSAEQNLLPLLAEVRGIDLALYFILQTSVSFCTKFFTGRVYDSKGRQWCIVSGAIALIIALLIMASAYTLTAILVAGFFVGFGVGALQPSMQTWALSSVPQERRSFASATYFTAYDIGLTLGAVTLGALPHVFGYTITFRAASVAMALFLGVYLVSYITSRRNAGD